MWVLISPDFTLTRYIQPGYKEKKIQIMGIELVRSVLNMLINRFEAHLKRFKNNKKYLNFRSPLEEDHRRWWKIE